MLTLYNKVQIFAFCTNSEEVCGSDTYPPPPLHLQIPRPAVARPCQLFHRFVVGANVPRRREERSAGTGETTRRKEDIRQASPP